MSITKPLNPELNTLILMVGLPYSGKSSEALRMWRGTGAPIVCPDAIRLALHGQRYQPLAEPFVWATAHAMVRALFLAGHPTVILDATNATQKRRDDWISPDWKLEFHVLHTSVEECVWRATEAGDLDIVPVIHKMSAAALAEAARE